MQGRARTFVPPLTLCVLGFGGCAHYTPKPLVPEHTAIRISGHRTRAIFDRYDIVSEGDLVEAARRIAATSPSGRGHNLGHIGAVAARNVPRKSLVQIGTRAPAGARA